MKKKVFSVLLTVALAIGVLAGCGRRAAVQQPATMQQPEPHRMREARQQVQLPQERNPETPS